MPITFDPHTDFGYSAVATAPSPATSGTTLSITAGHGSRFPSGSAFNVVIWPTGSNPLSGVAEIARVTRSGDVFTITRAQEGTSARAIMVGDQISSPFTSAMLSALENAINSLDYDLASDAEAIAGTETDIRLFSPAQLALAIAALGGGGGGGGSGDVTGPSGGVIDGEISVYNSTTGKIIKASGKTIAGVLADAATAAASASKSADTLTDGTTNKAYTATERTKLSGISPNATANSSDATLLARGNHTGTESADVIIDGTTNKAFTAVEKSKLATMDGAETSIASASTTAIGGVASEHVSITGTVTITSFGTIAAGVQRSGRFTGSLTLTHNATSLILPGGANITTAAGDSFIAISLGSGNWAVYSYVKANGTAVVGGSGGDVSQASNNAFTGINTFAGAVNVLFTNMSGTAIDLTKAGNSKSLTGDVSLTFSNNTPADGTTSILRFTADGTPRTVTLPAVTIYSLSRQTAITALTVAANATIMVQVRYIATRWEIINDAPATSGTGSYALTDSPTFTGAPLVPTAAGGTNTTQAASTAFAVGEAASKASKAANLSDLANAATARTNLGLGTAAVAAATDFKKAETQNTLTGTTPVITFTDADQYLDWTLSGDSTPTFAGIAAGRSVNLFITGDGSLRTLGGMSSFIWTGGAPANLAAGKRMRVCLEARGSSASSVFATYAVEA